MSSRSSVQAMYFWPKPMVYLPLGAPSKSSSSSSEMHCACERVEQEMAMHLACHCFLHFVDMAVGQDTHALGEVDLHGLDSDILRASHCCDEWGG